MTNSTIEQTVEDLPVVEYTADNLVALPAPALPPVPAHALSPIPLTTLQQRK